MEIIITIIVIIFSVFIFVYNPRPNKEKDIPLAKELKKETNKKYPKIQSFFDPDAFVNYNGKEVIRLNNLCHLENYDYGKRDMLKKFIEQYNIFVRKTAFLEQELSRCFSEDSITYEKFIIPINKARNNFSANLAKIANSFIADVYIDTDKIQKENQTYIDIVSEFLQQLIELNLGSSLKNQTDVVEELATLIQQLIYYK